MMTDPIADMITRIRNASRAGHPDLSCPSSRTKHALAQVLHEEGYVGEVSLEEGENRPSLRIGIRYRIDGTPMLDGIRRVSRPGCRIYVSATEVAPVRNGLGTAVLSTPKGILSDRAAREANVGGEVLCEVW